MNQVIIVGRIVRDVELKESENGKKYANATIAVTRSYKNADGVYETDFIDVSLFGNIAENLANYCKKGDVVAVRGKLQTSQYEHDGKNESRLTVHAERLQFLTTSKRFKENADRKDR